jgi:hypothetical protein
LNVPLYVFSVEEPVAWAVEERVVEGEEGVVELWPTEVELWLVEVGAGGAGGAATR